MSEHYCPTTLWPDPASFPHHYYIYAYINTLLVPDLPSHVGMAPDVEYWNE